MKRINLLKTCNPLLASLMLVIAISCTENIDIKLDSADYRLVVDGKLSTDTSTQTIQLSTSSSYFLNEKPPVVSDALVKISDETLTETYLIESPVGSGIYESPADFYGLKGMTYTLSIRLKEPIGGELNYDAVATMPETKLAIDSIALIYQPVWDFYLINLYATDPPTTDFYKLDALRNGHILTDTAYRSNVIDDRFFNGNNTNGLSVLLLRPDEVLPGDTITLILSSITKEYFNFFMELQSEAGQSTPLFSGPPANISSNIQPGGLGFFSTQTSVQASIIVKP